MLTSLRGTRGNTERNVSIATTDSGRLETEVAKFLAAVRAA
jgi:hypothetical protein